MSLSTIDVDFVCELVATESGNVVTPRQAYLLEQRLASIAVRKGLEGSAALVDEVRRTRSPKLKTEIAEAVTVNETSFFRDAHPYEALRKTIIPDLIRARKKTRSIRVWCAACSSGQEPYSIAITMRETVPRFKDWNIKILATDISQEMLNKAKSGEYSQLEVSRGLTRQKLVRHFDQKGDLWVAKPELRSMVDCRRINLSKPLPALGEFDIIFIRNVLIYFDHETKTDIFNRASKLLKQDGYLFLGSSETTIGTSISLTRNQIDDTVCYRFGQ